MNDLGAILLAGGRATRVGGADKMLFDVGGRTLLEHAIDAARTAAARPITVVGPRPETAGTGIPLGSDLTWVREDPPFGGPASAVVAALRGWDAAADPGWTLLLACDLPGVAAAVVRLRETIVLLPSDTDGVCLADAASRPQWLTALYRTTALRARAEALPEAGRDASMRALLDDLSIAAITAPTAETDDVDTWEDLTMARNRAAREGMEES